MFVVTEDWYFCSHRLPLACRARQAGFDVAVVTREGQYGNKIRSKAIRLIPLDMRRGRISVHRDLRTVFKLWRILQREHPEILHNVAVKPVILGTLAARASGVKRIINALAGLGYTFTSGDRKASILRSVASGSFRLLFKNPFVRVVVQNREDQDIVRGLGVPAERIALIAGSGVDTRMFKRMPEPNGPVTVVLVARMLWDKGVGDLVEAARLLKLRGHDISVRLVGPTDSANPSSIPDPILERWVRDEIVKWSGPSKDVASVWAKAHVGILPSYREGLPKSLLEAAACGRPLIATNVPGCRDVVIHEETGLLVPPRNPEALAAAILRLAGDPALRARLGKAARKRVEAHFSVDKVVEETLALYRSVLVAA